MASNYERPKVGEIRQWVSKVLSYSSQYSSSWGAQCIIGQPSVYPRYGDIKGAWASAEPGGHEFIEFEFDEAVYLSELNIYETYHGGAVKRILGKNSFDVWEVLYETPTCITITTSRIFTPYIERLGFPVNHFKIELDSTVCGSWSEIDAVELVGTKHDFKAPPQPWALAEDLGTLVDSCLFSDVTIRVGRRAFAGHKAILAMRSGFFKTMFCETMRDNTPDSEAIQFNDISAQAFNVLLYFIYTNKLKPTDDSIFLMEIWRVADLFIVNGLKDLALLEISKKVNASNAVRLYIDATTCAPVIEYVADLSMCYMRAYRGKIKNMSDFNNLPQDIREELMEAMSANESKKGIRGFFSRLIR